MNPLRTGSTDGSGDEPLIGMMIQMDSVFQPGGGGGSKKGVTLVVNGSVK